MEAIRNTAPGLKGRAIAGPHDYVRIPALAERSRQRAVHFLADLDDRLKQSTFVAGERFSVADITALVTIDFAAKAIDLQVPAELKSLRRWYHTVSSRPGAAA